MTPRAMLSVLGLVTLGGCGGTDGPAQSNELNLPPVSEAGGAPSSGGAMTGGAFSGTGGTSTVGTGGAAPTGGSEAGGAGGAASGGAGGGGSPMPSGGTGAATANGGSGSVGGDAPCEVKPLTDEFRASYGNLDPFYKRIADANGLPVIASDAPADEALSRACELVIDMLSERSDVRDRLITQHVRFAIMGENELTNEIPEFSDLPDSINTRARGLGGTMAASCAEESILCNRQLDAWRGEGICLHEFAHTISMSGLYAVDPTFESRLTAAYQNALSLGLLENTYRAESAQEYWAEGAQDWYFTNLESDPSSGIHNWVDRREELLEFDPTLHNLVAELLPATPKFVDCYSDE